jgi:hypothetical protein
MYVKAFTLGLLYWLAWIGLDPNIQVGVAIVVFRLACPPREACLRLVVRRRIQAISDASPVPAADCAAVDGVDQAHERAFMVVLRLSADLTGAGRATAPCSRGLCIFCHCTHVGGAPRVYVSNYPTKCSCIWVSSFGSPLPS